jgi:hypothetical protein
MRMMNSRPKIAVNHKMTVHIAIRRRREGEQVDLRQ